MTEHHLADEWLNIGYPNRDFDGYALFGALRGDGEFEALKMITLLGGVDGFDWGWKGVPADPEYCFYEIRLIGEERTVLFVAEPRRHEFSHSRDELDLRLDNRVHLSGTWPSMHWELSAPGGDLAISIDAKAETVMWSPDLVHRGTAWSTYLHMDYEYQGRALVDGRELDLSGIGTFDRPMGVLRKSARSPGVGFWQWDGLMINDAYGLFGWHAVDGNGDVLKSIGSTNFPDGVFKQGDLEFSYTSFEDRGNISQPRSWECTLRTDLGTMRYKVEAVGEHWDGVVAPLGTGLPNPLLRVQGEFAEPGGDRPAQAFTGKGTGESVQCLWDPVTNRPTRPW